MTIGRATAMLMIGALALPVAAQAGEPIFPAHGDKPAHYVEPTTGYNYTRRDVEMPMRDGVKLHTVILVPKGAAHAPILFTRTPYDADKHAGRNRSGNLASIVPQSAEVFANAGYIIVFQDVRGLHGSEGDYVMTRPPRGPLNPTNVDNTTDAWDAIDWLVKNVPETNGKVGMIGSSYEGHTVVMALLDPHPALKVAAPESPMVDGWMGDDWFHYGAFRQDGALGYVIGQESPKGADAAFITSNADDYDAYLRGGSAGDIAKAHGVDQFGMWRRMAEHPAYDAYWQGQALDKAVAAHPSKVPTMWLQGLWDQEDMWGAIHSWEALKGAGHLDNNYLVMGPWRHSQVNYEGYSLGPLKWAGNTTADFRQNVLLPFFDQYLKDGAPAYAMPRVQIYNTGENHWDKLPDWPLACASGCAKPMTPLYLAADAGLSFDKPKGAGADSYVSDPAHPIPFVPRPVNLSGTDQWKQWLVSDQREANTRTDVLSYETPVLDHAVRISGAPVADLLLATTGTDGDFVVKLIDVYPDEVPSQTELGGYQLGVAMDIFRGRYRDSFEHPSAIPANKTVRIKFALPTANHVFLPGHRIMVQVQSSWFPLYDRNPQTYVPNIFFAKPGDYKKATITVSRSSANPSAVWLPLVDAGAVAAQ
ncbi:CocE/NonD family hydrolase [Sphingomonas nostoxanthinifaciens]|uniref:CocE/NonD family hydrolase n=1 Tax=Sphingomonas nostoxanthinifaciens TaxID=2872652 RepID=UPI001CC1D840|nr:CocE/NonD family hydrolase [Sphingomonas nostoxanthinifaciens]UAK24290.1 CocE/NonD family hydrolase [Sphingomonas nostoxanthinifaciens]